MRLKFTVLVVAIAVTLGACNRERATITGSYGEGVLGGRVVMADGSSPAGVEVAVAGTGMRMVVGEDGSFAFANVPARAELLFHRESLMASMKVSAGERSLTVQLGPEGARSAGRRRSSRGGVKVYETEGLVRTASATELVVFDSHRQEVTFVLTPETVIRKGNTTLNAADLVADTRVHVKATLTDDVRTAILVIVQNDDEGEEGEGETATANGLVIATGASKITVRTQPRGDVTIQVDGATIIRKQGSQIAVTDIRPGDEVNCLGRKVNDTTILARQIEVRGKKGRS